MISSLDLSGWAGYIIEEYGISGTTTGSVVTWLENNVGKLNMLIKENYYVSGDPSQILPEMNDMAESIYTKMYECWYLKRQASQASVMGITDWIEIEGADQGRIRKVSKTEAAKELRGLANDCNSELLKLISAYLGQIDGVYRVPTQIIGDYGCC